MIESLLKFSFSISSPSDLSMIMLDFSLLVLRPGGDLWWVLKRVVLPCGVGYVLAVYVPVSSRCVPLLLLQQHTQVYPPDRPGPALLYLDVFTCVYPASPAWMAGLWESPHFGRCGD